MGASLSAARCRVLLSKPRLVLMDESTSALDTRNERVLYAALRAAGITAVSVGHRPTLLAYHDDALLLSGAGGGWEVRRAGEVSLEEAVTVGG